MTITTNIERHELVVANPSPPRLDAWLADRSELAATGLSRSRLHALTRAGNVTINGEPGRPAQRVRAGDVIVVIVPPAQTVANLEPQDIPITIVYEDSDIAVVDKPPGLPVHPGPGHPDGTLVNALLARCPDIRGVGGEIRPGIVHRLDLDTSGLLVVAKNQLAHQHLTEQLKNRTVSKQYRAVAVGIVAPEADTIDAPIGRHPYHRQRMAVVEDGRAARTHYQTEATAAGHTLLSLSLETGRTHQIRVHLAHRRFPILGDAVYGPATKLLDRQFLHAARLGLHHPATGQWMEFNAPLPLALTQAWDRLRNIPARSA